MNNNFNKNKMNNGKNQVQNKPETRMENCKHGHCDRDKNEKSYH